MTALPPSLDRFGGELENAVGRDLRRRHTRRRVVRGAAVLAVAGAVALGLLNGLTGGGPSVVQRAAAALESDGGILHYRMDAEQQNGDADAVLDPAGGRAEKQIGQESMSVGAHRH